jgi:hypothetical protein
MGFPMVRSSPLRSVPAVLWIRIPPTPSSLPNLTYYQTLLDKRLELKIGDTFNTFDFEGTTVGSNYSNPLGSSASIPVEVGIRPTLYAADSAVYMSYNGNLHNEFAVARSISPKAGTTLAERNAYPTGLNFGEPGPRRFTSMSWGINRRPPQGRSRLDYAEGEQKAKWGFSLSPRRNSIEFVQGAYASPKLNHN